MTHNKASISADTELATEIPYRCEFPVFALSLLAFQENDLSVVSAKYLFYCDSLALWLRLMQETVTQ